MLVLTRKVGETVVIDGGIVITLVEIRGERIRLSFDAPRGIKIHRGEVAAEIKKEKNHVCND